MTQFNPEQADNLSEEEVRLAETAEQEALNESQKTYLLKRVVLLRVRNNRLRAEVSSLSSQLADYKARVEDQNQPSEE